MKYLKYFESIRNYEYSNLKLINLNGLNIPIHVDGDFLLL